MSREDKLETQMPSVSAQGHRETAVAPGLHESLAPSGVPSSNCSAKATNLTISHLESNCYCYLSWNRLGYNIQNFFLSNSASDSFQVKDNRTINTLFLIFAVQTEAFSSDLGNY